MQESDPSGPTGADRLKVGLVRYDPAWPARFRVEADDIVGRIGPVVTAIEHIGSTAIPGMISKPTIDIMVGISALNPELLGPITTSLAPLGYQYDPAALADEPSRWVLRKGPPDVAEMRTHHLHVTVAGGAYWRRIVAFRDHLRGHSDDRAAYGALKTELAERFSTDRRSYTRAKRDFVRSVEARAEAAAGRSP